MTAVTRLELFELAVQIVVLRRRRARFGGCDQYYFPVPVNFHASDHKTRRLRPLNGASDVLLTKWRAAAADAQTSLSSIAKRSRRVTMTVLSGQTSNSICFIAI